MDPDQVLFLGARSRPGFSLGSDPDLVYPKGWIEANFSSSMDPDKVLFLVGPIWTRFFLRVGSGARFSYRTDRSQFFLENGSESGLFRTLDLDPAFPEVRVRI